MGQKGGTSHKKKLLHGMLLIFLCFAGFLVLNFQDLVIRSERRFFFLDGSSYRNLLVKFYILSVC